MGQSTFAVNRDVDNPRGQQRKGAAWAPVSSLVPHHFYDFLTIFFHPPSTLYPHSFYFHPYRLSFFSSSFPLLPLPFPLSVFTPIACYFPSPLFFPPPSYVYLSSSFPCPNRFSSPSILLYLPSSFFHPSTLSPSRLSGSPYLLLFYNRSTHPIFSPLVPSSPLFPPPLPFFFAPLPLLSTTHLIPGAEVEGLGYDLPPFTHNT